MFRSFINTSIYQFLFRSKTFSWLMLASAIIATALCWWKPIVNAFVLMLMSVPTMIMLYTELQRYVHTQHTNIQTNWLPNFIFKLINNNWFCWPISLTKTTGMSHKSHFYSYSYSYSYLSSSAYRPPSHSYLVLPLVWTYCGGQVYPSLFFNTSWNSLSPTTFIIIKPNESKFSGVFLEIMNEFYCTIYYY